jgi:hypothetical protein
MASLTVKPLSNLFLQTDRNTQSRTELLTLIDPKASNVTVPVRYRAGLRHKWKLLPARLTHRQPSRSFHLQTRRWKFDGWGAIAHWSS